MPHPLHSPPTSSAVLADQLWFSCSSCKGELKVPLALANTTGACPLCGQEVHIPAHSEKRNSVWLGQEPEAAGGEPLLPVDDPELDGDTRKCFRGDLQFRSGAAQPVTSARGFFDNEVSLPDKESVPRKESVAGKIPELPKSSLKDGAETKSGMESFSKPLRKFSEPIAPVLPFADVPAAKMSVPAAKEPLPKVAPKAEEVKEDTSMLVVSSLEKDSCLFKPLRKYPPKQRHRAGQKLQAVPILDVIAPPLPPPVAAIYAQAPVMQGPPTPVPFIAPLPAPPVIAYTVPPLVVARVEPQPLVAAYVAPEPPVVEMPVMPVLETVQIESSPVVVVEQRRDPLPPVWEEPETPAPKRVAVIKALERSVSMQRGSKSRGAANRRKYAVSPVVQAVTLPLAPAVSLPAPVVEPEQVIVPEPAPPVHQKAIQQVEMEAEVLPPVEVLPPKRLAIADLLEAEPAEHDVSPVVVGEPHQTEEAHLPVRIGGVIMPRYTLVPRGSQLRLWSQRAAIGMLCLLPLVAFSGFYMPYVRRVTAWVEEMKRSRISLEEIQQQTAANRSNPSAQGFKEDALAAMKQEWTKLTTPEKKMEGKNAITRPVVFRSSKTDFVTANPETDWPQILLRNHGVFHGHSSMEGGSSFLLEASDGSRWIATSAHLLGEAGGVEPPVPPGKLVTDLDRWRAHLPDKPDTFAEVLGGRQLMTVITSDWLAMRLTSDDAVLPVKPLRLRRTLLRPDETVFLVGLPYNDKSGATQHVYRGQVTTTSPVNPSQFAVLVQAGVDFSGFRGAPVLDAEGEVVGVLTDRWSTILLATRSELLAQLIEGK